MKTRLALLSALATAAGYSMENIPRSRNNGHSKYKPHQGAAECRRRRMTEETLTFDSCVDCGNECEPPYDNGDGEKRCEKCAVAKNKADNILWRTPILKHPAIINPKS